MYTCDECGRSVAAKMGDPIHVLSRGKFCETCLRKPATLTPAPAHSDGRGAAAKARWAAMTPEQRAERVRRMQAGRR